MSVDAIVPAPRKAVAARPLFPILVIIALITLIALMQTIGILDPGSVRGSRFGLVMAVSWCLGLVLWALGLVARRHSQFRVRTLAFLVAMAALYFGACREFGPPLPTLIAAGLASFAMIRAAVPGQSSGEAAPYRNRACRAAMMIGGLLMLAHVSRSFGHGLLVAAGVVGRPESWG